MFSLPSALQMNDLRRRHVSNDSEVFIEDRVPLNAEAWTEPAEDIVVHVTNGGVHP